MSLRPKHCYLSWRRLTKRRMSIVLPKELVQGAGRGQKLRGRICGLDVSLKGGKDALQFYLVTGPGLDDMLYIEAWREHARTTKALVKENQVVEITNLTTKALGDKVQWQATSLHVYGQVLAATKITSVAEDASLPHFPSMVRLEKLPHYKQVPHLINVAGIVVEIQVPSRWLEYCLCTAFSAIHSLIINYQTLASHQYSNQMIDLGAFKYQSDSASVACETCRRGVLSKDCSVEKP